MFNYYGCHYDMVWYHMRCPAASLLTCMWQAHASEANNANASEPNVCMQMLLTVSIKAKLMT